MLTNLVVIAAMTKHLEVACSSDSQRVVSSKCSLYGVYHYQNPGVDTLSLTITERSV